MESVKTAQRVALTTELRSPLKAARVKRLFDILIAAASLVCVAPILLLAMLAIVLDSKGAPLFSQSRIGRTGKKFRIYKLRTMRAGSEGINFKTERDDNRLTRVGKILRVLNLDELPQLVNILRGDMSIIGPRPLSVSETSFLTEQTGFQHTTPGLIPAMRPGLVGLEQINRSESLTYEQRFGFNSDYESNWSLKLDCLILFKAIKMCVPVWSSVLGGALILSLMIRFH